MTVQVEPSRFRRRSHITVDMPPELIRQLDRLAHQSHQGRSAYVRSLIVQQARQQLSAASASDA